MLHRDASGQDTYRRYRRYKRNFFVFFLFSGITYFESGIVWRRKNIQTRAVCTLSWVYWKDNFGSIASLFSDAHIASCWAAIQSSVSFLRSLKSILRTSMPWRGKVSTWWVWARWVLFGHSNFQVPVGHSRNRDSLLRLHQCPSASWSLRMWCQSRGASCFQASVAADAKPFLGSFVAVAWLLAMYILPWQCSLPLCDGTQGDQMDVKLSVTTLDTLKTLQIMALLDTGCTGSSVNREFIDWNQIKAQKLRSPIPVYNADSTPNSGGFIIDYVEMCMAIQDHSKRIIFTITNLGKSDLFLGYDWLKVHNPSIDWKEYMITFDWCPEMCNYITLIS